MSEISPEQQAREAALVERVVASFAGTPDPRTAELVEALTRHLHAFLRETRLTEEEWKRAIDFLTAVGHLTDDRRQEFILLSDVLGASMQTITINNQALRNATEATVFGPFFVEGSPDVGLGGDVAGGAPGEPCWVEGTVTGIDGTPVAGARIEVWEADADGLYDVQYGDDRVAGRGHLHTDDQGRYRFWAVTPTPYPIPDDGPVGELLRATGRSPMRASHLHLMVEAAGLPHPGHPHLPARRRLPGLRQRLRGARLPGRRRTPAAADDPHARRPGRRGALVPHRVRHRPGADPLGPGISPREKGTEGTCTEQSCTPQATSGTRSATTRRSSSRRTRSSRCPRPASAGRTCGPTAASRTSTVRRRSVTSTSGSCRRWGPRSALIKPGQFVVGSFIASDNTCPHCRAGFQSACVDRRGVGGEGAQAQALRVPLADGTLVATPEVPDDAMLPSLLAASDVLGTGWFAAVAAEVGPGKTAAVVGDGAVGLLGALAASRLGAERVIVFSRHESRQRLARDFGATDIVEERGDEGVAQIMELTDGVGADSVLECVGTDESFKQAIASTRAGGTVGYVGVPHGVDLGRAELFGPQVGLRGGPAPVRRFLPELIELIWNGEIDPGKVFDLTLPSQRGRRGLPRDGRAPRDQDPADALTSSGCSSSRGSLEHLGPASSHLIAHAPRGRP